MRCPVCAGEIDPCRALCAKHLAEMKPVSDEEILAAFEEGRRARQAAIDAYVPPQLPGGLRFR